MDMTPILTPEDPALRRAFDRAYDLAMYMDLGDDALLEEYTALKRDLAAMKPQTPAEAAMVAAALLDFGITETLSTDAHPWFERMTGRRMELTVGGRA